MKKPDPTSRGHALALVILSTLALLASSSISTATTQFTRKTGLTCNTCHTVFPRLNSFGDEYLRNGYQLPGEEKEARDEGFVEALGNLVGFRINLQPIGIETNSLRRDSLSAKQARLTFGNPNWIQMFVAGSVLKDVSFFTELEMSKAAFKMNWFYFNFTNLLGTSYANAQIGNISPLEFASYPNRLPQLPALKSEVMIVKSSDGKGEESMDMSSARPGIQLYSRNDFALLYGGVSPGASGVDVNQFLNYWGGLVLGLPADVVPGFDGSSLTMHYYAGTDTKGTGSKEQIENPFTRLSPQINIRFEDLIDLQAAFVIGKDENRGLNKISTEKPQVDFDYSGVGLDLGVKPLDFLHLAVHYDNFKSEAKIPDTDKPVVEYHRIVPAATLILNQNIRGTLYYEKDLTDKPAGDVVDKIYINLRAMF
jgi:hypothetical protein